MNNEERAPRNDVVYIRVEILQLVDASYPGFVECRLIDADAREHRIRDKLPVVGGCDESSFPQPGVVAGHVVERRTQSEGHELVTIDTEAPWGIESTTGQTRFDVRPDQLDTKP